MPENKQIITLKKIKDSTTDTNETETNTVEMFSPPPPYPDELKYQIDLNTNNFEVCFFLLNKLSRFF